MTSAPRGELRTQAQCHDSLNGNAFAIARQKRGNWGKLQQRDDVTYSALPEILLLLLRLFMLSILLLLLLLFLLFENSSVPG
jgi:hypothetical protein